MTKAILKTVQTACVITTIAGVSTLVARAADTDTSAGTSKYGSTTESTTSTTADHATKSFIKDAFRDNQTEIDLAGVGMTKAQNENLKKYCQMLQTDHTQANKELQPLAQKYGITEEQSKLREHEVTKFEKEAAGADFDKNLATELLKNHQKDIAKFERASTKLQEADVKQYAENMLPKLRDHLQQGATVAREVGVDQSTISSVLRKTPAVGGTSESQETQTGIGTSGKTDQGSGAKQLEPTTPPSKP